MPWLETIAAKPNFFASFRSTPTSQNELADGRCFLASVNSNSGSTLHLVCLEVYCSSCKLLFVVKVFPTAITVKQKLVENVEYIT
ncbi:hypothetical protein Hanom_Chr06g00502021 [Helianthus anomalus]